MDSVVMLTEFAAAKINLALHVTGRRPDGYHLLDSLVAFGRFGDRIVVSPSSEDSFAVDGPFAPSVPLDASNLVLKARDALRTAHSPGMAQPVSIRLTKNLPVASGVGGGSSDAAATLRALNQLWGAGLGPSELAAIGLSLGADVPMCLSSAALVARGVGDEVSPLAAFPSLGIVLVNPNVPVSTPAVFAALQSRDNAPMPPLPASIDFHSLRNWLDLTRNDLEPAAIRIAPAIGHAISALNRAGSGFTRMSGSGATCFGLYETGNVAKRAAAAIRACNPDWFVAATRTIASGPQAHEQD
ncbi:MAG: 4-(cytidine 5'-diphospho)-2-C-methyl-D-erythritol kinase [Mesorhizobium sp.]